MLEGLKKGKLNTRHMGVNVLLRNMHKILHSIKIHSILGKILKHWNGIV